MAVLIEQVRSLLQHILYTAESSKVRSCYKASLAQTLLSLHLQQFRLQTAMLDLVAVPVSRSCVRATASTRGVPTLLENSGGAAPVPPSPPI
jgi:hypothetical protein